MKKSSGFTIIEVLMVLAIGGLIIMLAFLALPQLERNGRNNQRKQDVGIILEAISHYELNHSGGFPNCGHDALSSCDAATQPLEFLKSKLSFYTDTGQIVITAQAPNASATNNPNTDTEKVYVFNYQKCDPNTAGKATTQGAGFNDVVALYAIESGSSATSVCHEL
jgi:prepilin-type N-terminal cleavage/methylation domain-containing protein